MAGQDSGVPSLGLQLKRGNGASPETFTAVAEVKDISGPALKVNMLESTHLGDTWVGRKPNTIDGGEIKLTCNFLVTNATQGLASGLLLDLANRSLRNFQLVWPDGTSWPLAAYVNGFTPKGSTTTILTVDVTLMIDGTPAFI